MNVYKQIAAFLQARIRSGKFQNEEWFEKHTITIEELCKNHMPSGSGFGRGTRLNLDKSSRDKLVFDTAFHHMDDNGYYCGWTDHQVIVTPAFDGGVWVRVTGRNFRDIKDYISGVFHNIN